MQWLGTPLIVTGFAHFAITIDQMQSLNNQKSWDQASNDAGINFGMSIDFNGPTAKEKNYSTGNSSAGSGKPNIEDYPDSRFFQGSDYDAAMLSKMLTENNGDVEHPYRSTPNGFYFEPTSGYIYQGQNGNGENIFTYDANNITNYNGYTKSVAHNFVTEYQDYFDAGTVMNRVSTIYRSHYHPWNAALSQDDIASTNAGYYPLYAIHGNEPLRFASNGVAYNTGRTIMDVYWGLFNMKNPWQSMK